MMRLVFFVATLFSLLTSCSVEYKEKTDYYKDGALKAETTFEIISGDTIKKTLVQYYPNGKVQMKGNFKRGKRDGIWKAFFEDGSPWSEAFYENGLREGASVVYFPSGGIHIKGQFKADKAHGTWIWFDESGKEEKRMDYKR